MSNSPLNDVGAKHFLLIKSLITDRETFASSTISFKEKYLSLIKTFLILSLEDVFLIFS